MTLATGARVAMKITKAGVMVSEDEKVEPIAPLGMLGGQLGYEVIFKNGECQIHHPVKGGDAEWLPPNPQEGSTSNHQRH